MDGQFDERDTDQIEGRKTEQDSNDREMIGTVSEPTTDVTRKSPERIEVDDILNHVDGSKIEGSYGDYLFTVGNVSCGKSTIQSFLIHRLWTDPRIMFEYISPDSDKSSDAYLNGWVQNIENGIFPRRSQAGTVREFNIQFGQVRRPALDLSFIEIAGEDIRSIVPGITASQATAPRLNQYLEQYLKEPGVNKRFLFISDAAANLPGSDRDASKLEEDILFSTLIRYLLGESGIGLKRLEILFLAAKWDEVKSVFKSDRQYFRLNFPQTLATVAETSRIRASFMPFSVGEVIADSSGADGETVARIIRKETKYVDTLISWIYETLKQSRLVGYPRVNKSFWDRLKNMFA